MVCLKKRKLNRLWLILSWWVFCFGGVSVGTAEHALRGSIVYQSNEDGDWDIWVMRADGEEKKKLTHNSTDDQYPRFSYDGNKVAFVSNRDGNKEIYCLEIATGKEERLTHHPAEDQDPDWAPNGEQLVFTSQRDGQDDLYLLSLANKQVMRLTTGPGRNALASWSPDGKKIVYSSNRLLGWSVYVLDLETKETTQVVKEKGACRPDWSSDGQWLALVSQQADGKGDIFLVRPNGQDLSRLTQTSQTYDYFPAWSGANEQVVFARTENKAHGPWDLFVIHVSTGEEVRLTQTSYSESFPDWTKNP